MTYGTGDYRYDVLENWMKLPEGWVVGDGVGISTNAEDNVYLIHRRAHPVIVFDRNGKILKSWGDGVFGRAHSVRVDREQNIFCVDDGGHAIFKFNPKGELLLTLGTPGKPSDTGAIGVDYRTIKRAAGPFNRVTDIAFAANGDLFVSDGYGNARIHHFSKDGKLLKSWGEPGAGQGQFHIPHNIAIDKNGRVLVADRENNRVQIFNQDGKYLTEWSDARRPAALFIDKKQNIIVGEMGYNQASMYNGGNIPPGEFFPRITVRNSEGKILSTWGSTDMCSPGSFWAPHTVCVDSRGDLYVGEVSETTGAPGAPPGCHPVQKFIKK